MSKPLSAPKKPPRRTQVERTEAMRARISAAAYETAVAGGINGLRMRSVAQTAGVSQGALLHHFPDKNTLVLAAIEQALLLAKQDSESLLESQAREPAEVLQAMLAEFRAFFFSDRFWVAMGLTMEAAKDPAFDPAVRAMVYSLRAPIYEAWSDRLTHAGWRHDDAVRTVRSGASLISGASIRRFWAAPDAVSSEVEREWLADRLRAL